MWDGYFTVDGVEIINAVRTEERVEAAGVGWLRRNYFNQSLARMLEEVNTSESAGLPWRDPRVPYAAEFYGILPLDVTGIADSTLATMVAESVVDGASSVGRRRSSKTPVFNVMLLGRSHRGVEYGFQWLKNALLGDYPTGHGGGGVSLGYLAAEPLVSGSDPISGCEGGRVGVSMTPEQEVRSLGRTLRGVEVASPPVQTSLRQTSDGWSVMTVTFTLVATNAYEYGVEQVLLEGLNVEGRNPWAGGGAPPGASISTAYDIEHEDCLPRIYSPIFDPIHPAIIPPPTSSDIVWGNFTPPPVWSRKRIVLPSSLIPGWTKVVPVIRFNVGDIDARSIRLRFHQDPGGYGDVEPGEECANVADLVVTYIPTGTTLVVDGVSGAIYADTSDGIRRRADSLVMSSSGGIFRWPELSGGVQHILTLDVAPGETLPWMDISLVEKIG